MTNICRELHKSDTDSKGSTAWLVEGKLDSDIEATVVEAQDGVTRTRRYLVRITEW